MARTAHYASPTVGGAGYDADGNEDLYKDIQEYDLERIKSMRCGTHTPPLERIKLLW
jgi:hypothetical protein